MQAFTGSLQYLAAAREAGVSCAALSASANSEAMLRRAGLAPLVGCIVDGNSSSATAWKGRPAPDTVIAACELLAVEPGNAASFETTIEGLTSSRTAGVGFPVGIGSAARRRSSEPTARRSS